MLLTREPGVLITEGRVCKTYMRKTEQCEDLVVTLLLQSHFLNSMNMEGLAVNTDILCLCTNKCSSIHHTAIISNHKHGA